jgi:NADH:ubiquinone oxidoreductase subunit 6 (subunit J)
VIEQFIFWTLAALVLLAALGVVTMRNTVHSALMLGLCLMGVAGLFAQLGADFLFAGQILVYVGGIAVLIMFVVMLLGRASDLHLRQVNNQWMAAALICSISAVGLWRIAKGYQMVKASGVPSPTTEPLGRLLLSDYAIPFELVSIVLLGALLGAVYFSHMEKEGRQ